MITNDEIAGRMLSGVLAGIARAQGSGRPEAVLREEVQPVLAAVLREQGLRAGSRDEARLMVPTEASAGDLDAPVAAIGRADAVYNRFVIEFEPPDSLRPSVIHSATRHAVSQVQQYLRGINAESGLPLERLAGCAFDGRWLVYVTWERGNWVIGRPRAVTAESLLGLTETLGSLSSGRGLTAANLDEDFGRVSETARLAVRALSRLLLSDSPNARTDAMYRQWERDQGNASGQLVVGDLPDWRGLCESLGVPSDQRRSPRVLFALQTYFSLVAKLTSLVILEGATGLRLVSALQEANGTRERFVELESGRMTAATQAVNAVEPGIFSWYAYEREPALQAALGRIVDVAAEYSAEVVDVSPASARDLMKDLYQRLVPTAIRHRLGEYYTPDWLAERVVNMVTAARTRLDPNNRVLDPACGSGTFLVEVISRMVSSSEGMDPDTALRLITRNVVGFDLSPLAVQASKVNYLLAIAPLLRRSQEHVSIPVYLADSVSPARRGTLLEGDVMILDSSEGDWAIPSAFAEPRAMSQLSAVLQEAVTAGRPREWVLRECERRIGDAIPAEGVIAVTVGDLYEKLSGIDAAERDGMWLPLLANAFAPYLHQPFNYVVGNPPWVSWETLPESYRRANEDQWDSYRLRPDLDGGRRQASVNVPLDLSMLFVARCMDKYVADDGRLGFVITASIFQSELGGRGFRRRYLPPDSQYRFVHIDDMSSLRIFDDAANRTAVVVADKRRQGDQPIPVVRWQAPPGERSIPIDMGMRQVGKRTTRRHLYAEPASPGDTASPLLIMARNGLLASRPLRRPSHYLDSIREGVNTRGANGILFVEVLGADAELVEIRNVPSLGRNDAVPARRGWVEKAAVKRLLRGLDVTRAMSTPSLGVLFFHDEDHTSYSMNPTVAAASFPRAFAFIGQFERELRNRRQFRNFDPSGDNWLALYSVTSASLMDHKVVVREISSGLIAAAVHGRDIVPDHKLYVIPVTTASEADLLASVLNSTIVDYTVRSFAISTSISGSFLRYIGIRDLSSLPTEDAEQLMPRALGLSDDEYRRLLSVAASELGAEAFAVA